MRKLFSPTALLITVCSLVTIAAAAYSTTCAVDKEVCTVVEEQAEKIERVDGTMLWESLSSQFVSSVHY